MFRNSSDVKAKFGLIHKFNYDLRVCMNKLTWWINLLGCENLPLTLHLNRATGINETMLVWNGFEQNVLCPDSFSI